ncbi:hypothetical protein MJO28_009769 [Puccinia striiformis f. sp. tritici]|uniref:Uncharacterized protein n=1 Tax=Puccinia striiformis f. sp. tritici TaxID=168172 RepID=A0ACC0EA90_9BASI|nr:hypothetical protein MJO28_009769 [Puccinia striiformis f. sp. tritici]
MKSSIGFFLLSIYLTISDCQVVSSRVDYHLNNLLARQEGARSSTRLVARQSGDNLQKFTEKLGGVAAPTVTKQGDIFRVEFGPENEKFSNLKSALTRSCDRQSNRCADNFNKKGPGRTADCNAQLDRCKKSVEQQVSGTGGTDPTVGGGGGDDRGGGGGGSGGGGSGDGGQEGNLQKFTGKLGGVAAPTVTKQGDVFKVEFGPPDEQFKELKSALTRSCDRQSNRCANKFNKEGGNRTGDCNNQLSACKESVVKQ